MVVNIADPHSGVSSCRSTEVLDGALRKKERKPLGEDGGFFVRFPAAEATTN